VRARPVEIQVDLSQGLPGMSFTGLPDASVTESRDRIRSALLNSGLSWPQRRITVALLPADVPKRGSRFDLAVAIALLASDEIVSRSAVANAAWIAELGLDGRLRPVRGVLPAVLALRDFGLQRIVVAPGNGAEAALVPGVDVRVAPSLAEIVAWMRGEAGALEQASEAPAPDADRLPPDLADVSGQELAKRALEVAAAGGHHLLLQGAPGAGKTMLAERLPGLLPELDDAAALEVTAVHSVAGLIGERASLIRRPPLQAPHHTASVASLVGGGSVLARPGAISLAHRGVLFLDEAPEFPGRVLEALRQPLEEGHVVVHRQGGAVSFPARFQLVLACNPCPCGARHTECTCAPAMRRRYQQKLSGPLLDRIDLRVQVEPVSSADLLEREAAGEASAAVAARVAAARSAARARWRGTPYACNAELPGSLLRNSRWALPPGVLAAVERYLHRGQISARGFDRVLRLSWTLADLAGRDRPDGSDVAEALFFRTGQATAWAA
jgi:magnesium chelatase family protein